MFRKVLTLTAIVLVFSACELQADVIHSTWGGRSRSVQKQRMKEKRGIKSRVIIKIFTKTAWETKTLDCSRRFW